MWKIDGDHATASGRHWGMLSARSNRCRSSAVALGALLALATTLAACGSSSTSSAASAPSTSTPTHLVFGSNGAPKLDGIKIAFGDAAGNFVIGDTNAYNVYLHLKEWGADATYTIASGATGQLGVRSGSLTTINGGFSTNADAGLIAFGPNQTHVDYVMVGQPSITSLAQLKGKTVTVATTVSGDTLLLGYALKKAGLTSSDVHTVYSGAESASVDQFISGRTDAAFVHSSALLKFNQDHIKYNILSVGATLLPGDTDSVMAASPSWLKANPAIAEAIDLAWLASAKVFDTNPSEWAKIAHQYTKGAEPVSYDLQAHKALLAIDGWPDNASAFTKAGLTQDLQINKAAGQMKGAGLAPLSKLVTFGPWNAAVKYFATHPNL